MWILDRLSRGITVLWGSLPHEPNRENQECGRRSFAVTVLDALLSYESARTGRFGPHWGGTLRECSFSGSLRRHSSRVFSRGAGLLPPVPTQSLCLIPLCWPGFVLDS